MAQTPSTLKVAVLLVPPVQLMDMAPVDLLFMLSKSYLRDCQLPQPIIDRGLDTVEIYYVADEQSCTTVPKSDPPTHLAELTACLHIPITHTLTSSAVAPGNIDIVLVPGPDPAIVVSESVRQFLRNHAVSSSTHILSVCTGIFVLGQAGILDGKSCTGPRPLIGMRLKKEFPRAKWTEKRWEVDESGRLWTAGGISNGQDMVAAYIRRRFSPELADLVCSFADVGHRPQDYDTSGASEGMGFLWILVRSFFKGLVGSGTKGGTAVKDTSAKTA